MTDSWTRLGRTVRRRRQELGLTQGVGGVSAATWRKVENAIEPPYREATLHRIAASLDWTSDSPERILAGDEPVEIPAPSEDPNIDLAPLVFDLQRRLAEVERQLGIRRRTDLDELEARAERNRARRAAAKSTG